MEFLDSPGMGVLGRRNQEGSRARRISRPASAPGADLEDLRIKGLTKVFGIHDKGTRQSPTGRQRVAPRATGWLAGKDANVEVLRRSAHSARPVGSHGRWRGAAAA